MNLKVWDADSMYVEMLAATADDRHADAARAARALRGLLLHEGAPPEGRDAASVLSRCAVTENWARQRDAQRLLGGRRP